MRIFLKRRIRNLVHNLEDRGKPALAECIRENWDKSALLYSQTLNTYSPARPMEKEMALAFKEELARLSTGTHVKDIVESLSKRRVLQTAPHLGATDIPRMLTINWLGSLGVPKDAYYVVGMFSGIPFSNKSRPGRINRKTESINLFPSTLQDGLVYQSLIPEKLIEALTKKHFPAALRKFLPQAVVNHSYTAWAVRTCQNIDRALLRKGNLIYLDLNEVVANYLVHVLSNPESVMHKIFFDKTTRNEFEALFPEEVLFYTPVLHEKHEKMEPIYFKGNNLEGKSKTINLNSPEFLIEEIKNRRLCPALLTTFLALAFLNEFKCFGSFRQVEYLPEYQKEFAKLSCVKELHIEHIPTKNLTTGTLPGGNHFPADILSVGKTFTPNEKTLFGELIIEMKDVLLEN